VSFHQNFSVVLFIRACHLPGPPLFISIDAP
jgi:hypothetical protein